jgi:flagellar basal-body rod protein FlgC
MSMFRIFDISGSAVSAQSQRLNVVASNLANADTVAGPDGTAYKARQVVFKTTLMGAQAGLGGAFPNGLPAGLPGAGEPGSAGITVSDITEDNTPGRKVHDPKHPSADADGMVTYSNVNPIEEMVNMISASRSYQNNIEVMSTAKNLLQRTLQMGQS